MHRRTSVFLLTMALAGVSGAPPSAQTRPAPGDIPRVPFEKYTLPNGLDVILSQNRSLPVVAVNLWYHVGPVNEDKGRTGFAHLFEHMMFQGSKHVPGDSHFKLLEAAGGTGNGTTDFDRTNYFETVPANQLELALWLESDRMGYLLEKVDQASLSNQQDVVRNERQERVENQPYGLAGEALIQALYPAGHPYHGNVIGSHEDIQAAKLEDVRRFFRQYYAPNNASIAIVGDFDTANVKQLVEKYFGSLKRGPAVPAPSAETPKITAERRLVVPSRVQLPRVSMAWITPSIYKPGDAEADITASILGSGRSSRLYKALVYERQIAQNVSAFQYSLMLGSLFEIDATARPGHTAAELELAIDEELAKLRAQPPSLEEIERARNTFETGTIGGLERVGGVANRLNQYNHFLGTPDFLEKDVLRYRAISPASVQTFARDYLQTANRVVLHAVPGQPPATSQQAPTSSASTSGSGGAEESVNPDEPWRNEVPKAGAARAVELATPVSAVLPNGLTLILSEKRGVPIVAANLVVKTGSDANPIDRPGLANFVAAMLDEGTTTRNALQIADQVAQLGASLTTGSSMDATTISTRALSKNFPAALDLLADVALRPSFPADEVERQRASRLAQLVQQRDAPEQVAAVVMASVLYGTRHPYGYAEVGTEASNKAMTPVEMTAFWRQNFVPNNAALVVAGEISMRDLRALAEKAFGSWQRGTPVRPDLGMPESTRARVVIVDKPGAPQTQLRVASIGVARSSPDFRAIQVMNNALGGLFSGRINMNLREAHGYSYGTYSQFVFRRSAGPFVVAGGVRTDVTAAAVGEIFKEVQGIVASPLADDELKKAKDAQANSLPGAFETSANMVNTYSNVFIYDLGLDYYTRYAREVNAVTTDQALAAARRYVVPDRLVVIAVGDRAAIEPGLRQLNLGTVEIRDSEGRPGS